MNAFWIKFQGHKPSCVEAESEDAAKVIAAEKSGASVVSCDRIPYPAEPRLNKWEHPQWGVTPSFCFKPDQCKGRTACPQNYSCTD